MFGGGAVASLGGLAWYRKIKADLRVIAAEGTAEAINQAIIDKLRGELDWRDKNYREQRDFDKERFTLLQSEYLAFKKSVQMEQGISREISKAVINDLRTINSGRVPEERLETQILRTGMGPLDSHD